MCAPVAFLAAGMLITAAAGYAQAKAQKAAGEANNQIAQNNAVLAEQGAKDAAILGAREQQQAAWRTRALIGQQKASLAANMIDSSDGTAFDLIGESALFGGAEQSAIAVNSARQAWGLQSEALNYRNQGNLAKWEGKTQSRITLAQTAGSMLSMYGQAGGFRGGGNGRMVGSTLSSGRGATMIGNGSAMRGYT